MGHILIKENLIYSLNLNIWIFLQQAEGLFDINREKHIS